MKKANGVIKRILGVEEVIGLRTPLGYVHRGDCKTTLSENPEVLEVLAQAGLGYVSSSLRSKDWGINAPLRENGFLRKPFFYPNHLVEIPSHGWQDTAFTGESKTKGTEGYPTSPEGIFGHYKNLISEAQDISKSFYQENFYLGLCMHPWAIRRYDPNLEVLSRLMELTNNNGIEHHSYRKCFEEMARLKYEVDNA